MSNVENARLNHAPDLSNRSRGWGGIVADLHWWHEPGEAMSLATDHDIVGMRVAGRSRLTQRRGGEVDEREVEFGNVTVHPRGMDSHWSWTQPGAILLLRIAPALVTEVHQRSGLALDLPNLFGGRSQALEHYFQLIFHELHVPDGPAKLLRWQSLSLAIVGHLVENHAGRAIVPFPSGGLSQSALRQVMNHIGDRWRDRISLQDLADAAGVSRFHFTRMFKASMGMTAMEYLENIRLDRARGMIVQENLGLAQVALATGFVDQSHFTRRFHRAFGLTPGEFAKAYRRR